MVDENTPILTAGEVTIDTDNDGVIYLRTQSGEVEVISNDIATTALIKVRQLELEVARLRELIEPKEG